MSKPKLPVVVITRVKVELSPPVDVFNVELTIKLDGSENGLTEGSWEESYGTEAEVNAFLRGCTAMASMVSTTQFVPPPIPREAKLRVKSVETD